MADLEVTDEPCGDGRRLVDVSSVEDDVPGVVDNEAGMDDAPIHAEARPSWVL